MNHLVVAKKVISKESEALDILSQNIPKDFSSLIDYILTFKGRVILIGMGKSGYIAKKIAASLASTGTPAFFIHPSEASHGDLGMITAEDLVVMISNSGETKELFDTINYCKRHNIKIASITMKEESTLATNSDFLLLLPKQKESSTISAPTTSALMTLSLGDAIVTTLHEAKGFTKDDFLQFHPGGKIGANLLKVEEIMRTRDKLPSILESTSFSDAIVVMTEKCLGCAIVTNAENNIVGIITDGDLRRHIKDDLNNISASDVMTKNPQTINADSLATKALFIMNDKGVTTLPVIEDNKLVGAIHIHDVLKSGIG